MPGLAKALEQLHAGNLQGSSTICQDILTSDPQNSQALCLLGIISHLKGDNHTACRLFEDALYANPQNVLAVCNHGFVLLQLDKIDEAVRSLQAALYLEYELPETHFHLANAFAKQGKLPEAVNHYQQAILLKKDFHDAYFNLGTAYKKLRLYGSATDAFQKALTLRPNDSETLFNLALISQAQGHLEQCITLYLKALEINPHAAKIYYNLAIAYHEQGNIPSAIQLFKQAHLLSPHDEKILNNLGLALHDQNRRKDAIELFQKAINIKPDFSDAFINLGISLLEEEKFAEASAALNKALSIDPTLSKAWYNLGIWHQRQNETLDSIRAYKQAIQLNPDFVQAHWNLSHALLLDGQFIDGFKEYLWRWQRESAVILDIPKPEWQGEELPAGTVLVHTEQGLGDSIQFVRYLPLVKERVGKIVLACEQSLACLLRSLPCVDSVIAKNELAEAIHSIGRHIPLLNLPQVFKTTVDSLPDTGPYISPDKELVSQYDHIFHKHDGNLKIGIVWSGNPKHKNDRNRSCRLEDFSPLFALPGISFFSLQKQSEAPDKNFSIINLAPHLTTFADTAALIDHLDLVISVDTSVAHLAGAMGKPVWVLIPFVPDWRWMLNREDSPWYPTMRLFRQQQRGDWAGVFKRLATELGELNDKKAAS